MQLSLVWVALPAIIGSANAWAGPPFITDDPEPVEFGHHELYFSTQISGGPEGQNYLLPMVEFNYGALPDLQLHVIAPMTLEKPTGESAKYGFGDTELGAKYRFVHESSATPQIGVFPLVELPTGNKDRGLGGGSTQFFLPLWLQKSWGPWTSYGGGGWSINSGDGHESFWHLGWEIQRRLSDSFFLGMEVLYNTRSNKGAPDLLGTNLGGQFDFSETEHLLFSGGHSIGPDHETFGYLGVMFN